MLTYLKRIRRQNGFTQQELSSASGVSRATISAIESGHCSPSVQIAIQLAHALRTTVESIFGKTGQSPYDRLARPPGSNEDRFWCADVFEQRIAFPVEMPFASWAPHDGLLSTARSKPGDSHLAVNTLVVASCDPFIGLIRDELAKQGVRLISLQRTSRESLRLLELGLVHMAGIHFGSDQSSTQNYDAVTQLRKFSPYKLLRYATWNAGVASSENYDSYTIERIINTDCRWINRPMGSSARASLDEILRTRTSTQAVIGYTNEANSHQAVADIINCGAADAGWILEAVASSQSLSFRPVKKEFYDLCFSGQFEEDPRYRAFLDLVRSSEFRNLFRAIPGIETRNAGDIVNVS